MPNWITDPYVIFNENAKDSDEIIKALLDVRTKAREQKDWNAADEIRKKLEEIGYEIQDTEKGPVWRRK